ncbi:MAG: PH domain-containing protein [Patescibacteria group bacterium]
MTIGTSFFFLCTWLFAFIEFTDYYLDTWIVTTERIISIEQKGLFERTASELDLISVQDATAEVHGFLETIFEFGDVLVQTAGEQKRFHFLSVNNPEQIKETVMKLTREAKERMSTRGVVHAQATIQTPVEIKTPSVS